MSYYSIAKVDLREFPEYNEKLSVEENAQEVLKEASACKSYLDQVWFEITLMCAASPNTLVSKEESAYDFIVKKSKELLTTMKEYTEKMEYLYSLYYLINDTIDQPKAPHVRYSWVNHYVLAQYVPDGVVEMAEDEIKERRKYIENDCRRIAVLIAQVPTKPEENEIDLVNTLNSYRDGIEEFYSDIILDNLFIKFPSKNEDSPDPEGWFSQLDDVS